MPRMRILSTQEQEDFDRPPVFDYAERKQMFSLPKSLLETARALRTPNSQIGFLLMCGYFRASKRFFLPRDFHERDIEFAAGILELLPSDFIPPDYVKTTRLRHQKIILDFYGFRLFHERGCPSECGNPYRLWSRHGRTDEVTASEAGLT